MRKRALALLMACTMVFSLTACGSKTGDTTTEKTTTTDTTEKTETTDTAETETQAKQTEITWWAFPTFAQETKDTPPGTYEQTIIDAFHAKNPDIKVKLETIDFTSGPEKITAAIEGGTICDVLFDAPGRIISYGKAGKLADISDMFTDEFNKDVGNPMILQSCKAGETAYMYRFIWHLTRKW